MRAHFLTSIVFLLLLVVVYPHVEWEDASVIWRPLKKKETKYQSPAISRLQDAGYILRYELQEYPDALVVGQADPIRQLNHRPEFRFRHRYRREHLETTGRGVGKVVDLLTSRGIEVTVVVSTPKSCNVKVETMPPYNLWSEYVGPLQTSVESCRDNFESYSASFSSRALDTLRVLSTPGAFKPWDNHWSILGTALVAKAVLEKRFSSSVELRAGESEMASLHAYLVNMLQVPHWYLRRSKDFQWKQTTYSISTTKPKSVDRVIVIGTSMSSNLSGDNTSLASILAAGLGVPMLDYSIAAGAHSGGWKKLVKDKVRLRPTDLVVWEIQPWAIENPTAEFSRLHDLISSALPPTRDVASAPASVAPSSFEP